VDQEFGRGRLHGRDCVGSKCQVPLKRDWKKSLWGEKRICHDSGPLPSCLRTSGGRMAVAGKPKSWHESQRYKGKPQNKQFRKNTHLHTAVRNMRLSRT
jgi:hypothetical protein